MLLKTSTNEFYIKSTFDNEAELEAIITKYADNIFGEQSIYIPQPVILTQEGRSTRPDAIVVDLLNKKRYVIEVELGMHDVRKHIVPQVSLQIVSSQNIDSKDRIKNKLLDKKYNSKFQDIGLNTIAIEPYITSILSKDPIVLIPIDFVNPDLGVWKQTTKYQIEIREINKFVGLDGEIYISFPDEIIEGDTINTMLPDNKEENEQIIGENTRQSFSGTLNDLLSNNILSINESILFKYKTKGGQEISQEGIIKEGGIVEIDGNKFNSLSSAGSFAIQKHLNISSSINGRWYWFDKNGDRLFYLRENFQNLNKLI